VIAAGFTFAGMDARVHLVWAVPVLLALFILAQRKRRAAAAFFLGAGGDAAEFAVAGRRRRIRFALLAAGLLTLVFAALGPRANPVKVRAPAMVRDLAILLDVSNSMLAEDRKPNRLESAKLEIARLADRLDGDRVGLIAFAGDAVVVCPLTSNYSYFKRSLRNVTTRTAGQGGTRIGDAIRKAVSDLLNLDATIGAAAEVRPGETVMDPLSGEKPGRHADLLLLTDGEDHDSYPEYAARNLGALGAGLFAVGLGSPEGREVPGESGFLRYRGEVVRSALMDKALRELVLASGRGRYLPAGVHHFDLVDFWEKQVKSDAGREVREERIVWQEVFQPFVLGGLLLVLLALSLPLAAGRRP
jgi:Ca-activated chloride channel family protein